MRGIIWYWENTEQAKNLLKRMIEKYERIGVKLKSQRLACRETAREMHVEFENGDRWDVFHAREQQRGQKCNISYVSRAIPEEVVHVLIMPCTTAYPYQGINYWYEEPIAVPSANEESVTR